MINPIFTQINGVIQQGRGVAAGILGLPYSVYRLNASSNVSVLSQPPVIESFSAELERASKADVESAMFELLAYRATCDNTQLALGDVLQGVSALDSSTYTFAQYRALKATIFARTDFSATISRPYPPGGAGAYASQPASGAVAVPDGTYIARTLASAQVLTLSSGAYAYAPAGSTAATIFVGLQPLAHVADNKDLKIADATARSRFMCFVPLMPGVSLQRNDIIETSQGRFTVMLSHASKNTGLAGWIAITEKIH